MSAPPPELPAGYAVHPSPPPLESYLHIRRESGLTALSPTQGERALAGCWFCLHIAYTPPGSDAAPEIVGIGRIIADGGWYFHIADVAVLPTHQRKGLGNVIMASLLQKIADEAEPGYYVNLFADPPGRKLYQKWGLKESMPEEMGMGKWVGGRGEKKGEGWWPKGDQ